MNERGLIGRLLPRRLDSAYHGPSAALWLFGAVLLVKVLQSLMSIFNAYTIALTADGIPLDTYGAAAAQTAVALFAMLGEARLPFYALCALALARYRSAVPLCFALLALDYLARSAVLYYHPIVRNSTAGGLVVNRLLFGLMLIGLVLSLLPPRQRAAD